MTEELSYEAYLSISQNKFTIYLLEKKNLKNIYKKEVYIENNSDLIDYNLLSDFLEDNIFKIEKLIGKFLKNIVVVIDSNKILNFSVGIKKKNYGELINKKYLENSLTELNDLFKENYQNNKIMHFILVKYLVNGINYTSFEKEINGDYICVEVNFIAVPNNLIKNIGSVLEKYQIKIDRFLNYKYITNFYEKEILDLSIMAHMIQNGQNQKEINLIPKSPEKIGFFEKFFQLFS
tara:strand:- start:1513 stop:2217 length:705 start_codon:yes stop_codon:yes gene_type:complete